MGVWVWVGHTSPGEAGRGSSDRSWRETWRWRAGCWEEVPASPQHQEGLVKAHPSLLSFRLPPALPLAEPTWEPVDRQCRDAVPRVSPLVRRVGDRGRGAPACRARGASGELPAWRCFQALVPCLGKNICFGGSYPKPSWHCGRELRPRNRPGSKCRDVGSGC